jgi:hypothetical protein
MLRHSVIGGQVFAQRCCARRRREMFRRLSRQVLGDVVVGVIHKNDTKTERPRWPAKEAYMGVLIGVR